MDTLGCLPALNHLGAGQLVASLRLRLPYASQAETPPSGVPVKTAALRRCRTQLVSLLEARPAIAPALVEIAMRDCGNFVAGKGGGANGCIRFGAEREAGIRARAGGAQLEAALGELATVHAAVAYVVSWADVVSVSLSRCLSEPFSLSFSLCVDGFRV